MASSTCICVHASSAIVSGLLESRMAAAEAAPNMIVRQRETRRVWLLEPCFNFGKLIMDFILILRGPSFQVQMLFLHEVVDFFVQNIRYEIANSPVKPRGMGKETLREGRAHFLRN